MNCPHCGHHRNRVLETRENPSDNAIRRRHACRGCGKSFSTVQRVEAFQDGAWQPVPLAVVPDPKPVASAPAAPRKRAAGAAPARLHPITGAEPWLADIERDGLPPELLDKMLTWWNESRWGKHRAQATWTQLAFTLSAGRVVYLVKQSQSHIAHSLVDAGIEHGWQALKPEYLRGSYATLESAAATPAGDPAALAIREMLEDAGAA
jgi:hypothetical protein